jgi:uncharacterized membrane protein
MDSNGALVVSTNQPKGKMIKVLFEPNATLDEPLTYDITAWSIPYAYGLETVASTTLVSGSVKNPVTINNIAVANAAGYISKWDSMQDAAFMSELLQEDIRVRFSEKELIFGGKTFERGSLVITKSDNRKNEDFSQKLISIANKHNRKLYASTTSFADAITDFGSPDVKLINKQRVAMLQGEGTSSLSYGALWHFFETQLKYPITSINTSDFSASVLQNYDVLVMPEGWYGRMLNEEKMKDLKDWVQSGGKVIAIGGAVRSFADKEGFGLVSNKDKDDSEDKKEDAKDTLIPYDQRERSEVPNLITGSIFKTSLDVTHPMAFGYDKDYYTLKLGGSSYKFLENGFNVGYIKDAPVVVSGFAGETATKSLTNSLVFGEERMGSGSIIYMVDDVMFRSFWENGKLLFVNSIFFVNNNRFTL